MATTSRDGKVRLWNWKRLQDPPIVLDDHDEWVWSATFSPDDEQLMVGIHSNRVNSNETIHVWPTKLTTMANRLCAYVTRNLTREEWEIFAEGLEYERTCENLPAPDKK